ncbi:glycosyltransferase 25 family member-like [Brevipalpus obovatus]|uniref:glycosyltransferase 25 family member-like n=1 Tax=Brevipalpus obovatus TaxID=246614 RepID=UPI003D9EB284
MPLSAATDQEKSDQDLIDLQFESSSDSNSFPVTKSLIPFTWTSSSKKDKLGMNEIYIINLKRRPKRLERMIKTLNRLGVDAKVWPAVDGKELSMANLIRNNIAMMDGYVDPYRKMPMTFGEIACFLSHYQIWQEVVERNYSKVIIFEDDVRFEREFRTKWIKHLENLEEYISYGGKVDFVYLGRMVLVNRTEEKAPVEGFVYPEYSYWANGYMLTSTGAKKLLDAQPLQKVISVDEYIPILYQKNPVKEWSEHFPNRTLIAFSVKPLLIRPTHFWGNKHHISDTFNSTSYFNPSTHVDEIQDAHTEKHLSSNNIENRVATSSKQESTRDQCQKKSGSIHNESPSTPPRITFGQTVLQMF